MVHFVSNLAGFINDMAYLIKVKVTMSEESGSYRWLDYADNTAKGMWDSL